MPLAAQSLIPLPAVPGVGLTCHVATWFWAAQEAQALGYTAVKPPLTTLGNIAALPPQAAMLGLTRSGNWDFGITPTTPPDGSVLLWTTGATHSAIVSGAGVITGYNQVVQFPALIPNVGHTNGTPAMLAANQRACVVVTENTIVTQAGALNL